LLSGLIPKPKLGENEGLSSEMPLPWVNSLKAITPKFLTVGFTDAGLFQTAK
jgi:hypothetical protein